MRKKKCPKCNGIGKAFIVIGVDKKKTCFRCNGSGLIYVLTGKVTSG